MDILDTIKKRRSIRNYTQEPVERELLLKLIEYGTAAPTAANCQPWEFVVVDEPQVLAKIRDKLLYARYNAPAAIVVCGNMDLAFKGPEKRQLDPSLIPYCFFSSGI